MCTVSITVHAHTTGSPSCLPLRLKGFKSNVCMHVSSGGGALEMPGVQRRGSESMGRIFLPSSQSTDCSFKSVGSSVQDRLGDMSSPSSLLLLTTGLEKWFNYAADPSGGNDTLVPQTVCKAMANRGDHIKTTVQKMAFPYKPC